MFERGQSMNRKFILYLQKLDFPIKMFLLLSVLFGALVIKIVPPMQAPDEIGHFVRATAFSELKIVPEPKSETTGAKGTNTWGEYGFKVPHEIYRINQYAIEKRGQNEKYPYQFSTKEEKEDVFIGTGGITNYSFLNYVPQIVGITTGRVLGQSYLWQYYATRICDLIAYIALVFLAIRIFPFSKWGATLLALNPMSLFLASSGSGDAMIISTSLLFTSLLFKLTKQKKVSNKNMFVSGLLLVALVLMKPTLIVLGLLYFLIPNQRLTIRRKFIWGILLFFACILVYLLWNKMMIDPQLLYRDFADPKEQVATFLKNPIIFFKNLFVNYFFGTKGSGIIHSFVGIFGLLDAPIGWQWVSLYFCSLTFACLIPGKDRFFFTFSQKMMTAMTIFSYIILTFFALYQIWNKVGATKSIEGLQGRYFIPGSFLLVPLFSSTDMQLTITNKKANIILSMAILLLLLAAVGTLVQRFS